MQRLFVRCLNVRPVRHRHRVPVILALLMLALFVQLLVPMQLEVDASARPMEREDFGSEFYPEPTEGNTVPVSNLPRSEREPVVRVIQNRSLTVRQYSLQGAELTPVASYDTDGWELGPSDDLRTLRRVDRREYARHEGRYYRVTPTSWRVSPVDGAKTTAGAVGWFCIVLAAWNGYYSARGDAD